MSHRSRRAGRSGSASTWGYKAMSTHTERHLGVLVMAGMVCLGACSKTFTEPDLNLASISGFTSNPTLSGVNGLVIGMVSGVRGNAATETIALGTIGREGYGICASCANLPYIIQLPLSAVNLGQIGGNGPGGMYGGQYTDLREAQIVLSGLPKVQGITAAQAAGIVGFIQTLEAIDLTTLIVTRDTFGITIYPNPDPTGPPGPVAPKAVAYQRVLSLLDSGYTNLQNGGAAFTFTLPPGFAGFNTPATFALVNRGLRARVDVHLSNYAQALTDLTA